MIFYPLCPRCVEEQLPSNQPFSKIDHQKIPLMKINMLQELEEFINKQIETTINDTDNNNNNNNNKNIFSFINYWWQQTSFFFNNTPTSTATPPPPIASTSKNMRNEQKKKKKKIACSSRIESHWLKREYYLFGLPSTVNHRK